MDQILDGVWAHFEVVLNHVIQILGHAISPLEVFGPGFVIFVLALLVVLFSRFFSKVYVTKRYRMLEKEFEHWQNVREEAYKHPDSEKAKRLARNIDQAELNRAYYDFFFEGMLNNIVTNVLPILLTAAFIIQIYTPKTLMEKFGDPWVFTLAFGESAIRFSSFFWYIISLLICFILYAIINMVVKKKDPRSDFAENNI